MCQLLCTVKMKVLSISITLTPPIHKMHFVLLKSLYKTSAASVT